MKPILVPCKTCRGTGRVELVPSLRQTLDMLRSGPATAQELAARVRAVMPEGQRHHCPSPNAFNNRLEDLRSFGFVARDRHTPNERGWRYFLTRNVSALTGPIGRMEIG